MKQKDKRNVNKNKFLYKKYKLYSIIIMTRLKERGKKINEEM